MTQEELYKSLRDAAFGEIDRRNCLISETAKQQLNEIIRIGVDRMSVNDRYNGVRIAEAQQNAKRMATYMCNKIESYGAGGRIQLHMINESLVREAKLSICPIWPFC